MQCLRTLSIFTFLILVTQVAQAQLIFNFNPAGLTGKPGSSVTFNATLTNVGNDTIWLNGDNSSISVPGLSIDDTDYFTNFPFFLQGGDSATADLFTVSIDSNTPDGNYIGSFTIIGGLDDSSQATLASQSFLMNVSSSTPEPGSNAFFAGLGISSILAFRRYKKSAEYIEAA